MTTFFSSLLISQRFLRQIEQTEILLASNQPTNFFELFSQTIKLKSELEGITQSFEMMSTPFRSFRINPTLSHSLIERIDKINAFLLKKTHLTFLDNPALTFDFNKYCHALNQTQDMDLIKFLVSKVSLSAPHFWGLILRYASRNGYERVINIILKERLIITPRDLGYALRHATRIGNENIFNALMLHQAIMPVTHINFCLKWAAAHRHENIIRAFIQQQIKFSTENVANVLSDILANFDVELSSLFISNCIKLEDIHNVLLIATERSNEITVKFLLDEFEFCQTIIGQALIKACQKGNPTIVQCLLQEGRNISRQDLFFAALNAVESGNAPLLGYLFAKGRVIGDIDFISLLMKIVEFKLLNSLRFMTSNVITSGIVNRALLNATKLGLAHIVEFIFSEHLFLDLNPELELQDNESLTNLYTFSLFYLVDAETKGLMLSYAVEQRDANMIELILSKLDQISLVHLSYSLKAMIKTGNQDITLMLLNYIKSQGIDFRSLNLTKGDYPIYFLTFAEVENDPMLFLNDLSNGFPARIILKDNFFVVDISGVTKQFLGVLFSSLVKKISLDENKLPLILGVDDDLPLEIHTKALREKERLENIFSLLGTAINSLYLKNQDRSDKYVFGNLFHTQFFQILKYVESSLRFEERLSEEDLYKLTAKLIAKIDPKITAAFIVAPHETQEDILEFAKVFEIPSGISEKEQIKRIQTKISEVITLFDQAFDCQDPSERLLLAKSHIKTYIHPAQKLFEALSDECKAFLKDTSARVLAAHVQGKKATAEALIRALFINEEIALKGLLQKVEWLKEKITSSNDQWREAFVFTITGNNFLSPGIRINIKNSSQELFEVHTCFNSIDLPKGKMSKIRFLEGIDSILQDPSYNVS